jgi:diguanylate cyclase (GGDEF)-like protein
MATQNAALKRLLSSDLPTDRLGPHLRNACRRAVRSGGTERMRLVARVVVAELDRRGDLKLVALDDPTDCRRLYLIRGTSRVVDLTTVGDVVPEPSKTQAILPQDPTPISVPVPVPEPAITKPVGPESPAFNFQHFIGMLGAMEHAQDLDLGDAVSSDRGTILAGVMNLLQRFTPQFQLYVLLQDGVVPPEDQDALFVLPGTESSQGWVGDRAPGHSVWIPRLEELPAPIRNSLQKKFDGRFQTRASVAVPLWEPRDEDNGAAHQESGLLFMVTGHEEGRDELLSLAQRLSRFVTRRWQQQQEMNQRIHVDSLTRVFNRGYFDSQFTLELERARRSEVPLSLVIADLDLFKGVNDTYGHQSGDVVLRMAARRLQEELRRIDHVCRIGGEEFALILPATSQEAAQEVVGRLLDSDFSCRVFHDGSEVDLKVTFSFGAVSFPSAGSDPFELFRKADTMLYLSKDIGRNRCHFWNSDENHTQLLPSPRID